MTKINIDYMASGVKKSAGECGFAGKGFEEQWLKVLEQVHLQKQVTAMHSTGSHDQPVNQSGSAKAPNETGAVTRYIEPFFCGQQHTFVHTEKADSAAAEGKIGGGVILCESARAEMPKPTPVIKVDNPLVQEHCGNSKSPAAIGRSSLDLPAVRRMLPPSSMLTAFNTDDGVHIVIRDASLEETDVIHIIEKIRAVFAAQKKRLAAVTLNGAVIWKSRPSAQPERADGDVSREQWINKIF